jgi:hypothetical protein
LSKRIRLTPPEQAGTERKASILILLIVHLL